jgi:ketosteroid isomerase-like protein
VKTLMEESSMKSTIAAFALIVAVPSLALAHVGVRPRESKPGAEERYSVRVPTEGAVATTSVRLEIPDDMTVLEVEKMGGESFEVEKKGDRIVAITWKRNIPPKESADFFFKARNPATGTEIAWKAHQHFGDGTVADWIGASGDRRPAAVTKLSASDVGAQSNDVATIEAWLKAYDAAFNAKDLDKLATFYHPDVTIYEGGGINNGWIDYRDHHLAPELKSFENLEFGHSNMKVTVLSGGQSAYATSEYAIKAKMGDRQLDSGGLETLVLVKSADGTWKIRHSHTSSRARRPPA